MEYASLLEPQYGYSPDVIKLTGFARHDRLLTLQTEATIKKLVVIAPTWRNNLAPKNRSVRDEKKSLLRQTNWELELFMKRNF